MKTTTRLVNQTFIEDLHTHQEIAKRAFTELKKSDVGNQNQEKLRKRENKNRYMVFNYLWHHFPEVMATKDQNPALLHRGMRDSEFIKVLKAAKRFYGFWVIMGSVIVVGSIIGIILGAIFASSDIIRGFCILGIPVILLPIDFLILLSALSPYFDPENCSSAIVCKRKKLIELFRKKY